MAASPLLLGIDLGTSSVKVALYDLDGGVQAEATVEYPILRPQPGFAEQQPSAWWHAVGTAVRATMAHARNLKAGPAPVAAIGLSGQMHGVVLTDADGLPLANAVIWPDQRSGAQVRAITEQFGAEPLVALTGSPVATGFMAATLRWMADEDPALLARATWALAPKDWLRLQMTGDAASDPSDGSGALLLDVQTRRWAAAMPAVVGFRADLLPPLRVAASVAGGLTASAAAHLDLPPGTPVATGAADAACALLGAGAADGRTLVVNLSTGGQLVLPASTPAVDLHGRLHTFAGALEPGDGRAGWYHMGAVLNV
ncbi:MAG: FGGY family carbohydrate kinase, partial [Caldilineaceae bacterium]